MSASLSGRRLLVVGASSGIGRATAQRAVALGADVALAARRREHLEKVAAKAGGGHVVVGDVRDAEDCRRVVDEAVAALGGLDALVYATGVTPLVRIEEATAADWDELLRANATGAALVTAAAHPHLGSGSVAVYLSSDITVAPRHGMATYAASKAALDQIVGGWRLEHPDRRYVRVRIGPTGRTEAGAGMDHDLAAEMFPRWMEHGRNVHPPMDAVDLGALLAESLAVWLDHPLVGVEDLHVGPVAPPPGVERAW